MSEKKNLLFCAREISAKMGKYTVKLWWAVTVVHVVSKHGKRHPPQPVTEHSGGRDPSNYVDMVHLQAVYSLDLCRLH